MRVYNATIIAIGVMFVLLIGGISTTSSKVIDSIGGNGPSLWKNSALWVAVAVALAAFVATNKISAGGFSFQASRESVVAAFAAALYVFFVSDLLSVVSKVGETSCPVGSVITGCTWQYWVIWGMFIPLVAGYGISLVEFIGGSD